jgi:hypothetical protein
MCPIDDRGSIKREYQLEIKNLFLNAFNIISVAIMQPYHERSEL